MKNILITGGSGFLAGKIFKNLQSDFNVILGARDIRKLSAYSSKSVRFFDISATQSYPDALAGMDGVIHLAAMDFQDCEKYPQLAQTINVDRVSDLLKACSNGKINRFIYFSTIHVYGSLLGEISEETPVNPLNIYSKTHYQAEGLVLKQHGQVIRLSNAIGLPAFKEASTWRLVVMDLCRQAVENQKMTLQSSGLQKRDFIPGSAIGEAVKVLLQNPNSNEVQVYNVGGDRTYSILEIGQLIQAKYKDLTGHEIELHTKPSEGEKINEFHYSLNKIKQLGFKSSSLVENEITDILKGLLISRK